MAIESFASNTPQNSSILQLTRFTFIIPDKPYLKYFCQTVGIPSVSTNAVAVPTPLTNTYRHGDKMEFEPLTITAIVDEDMRIWEETYNWMKGLTRPSDSNEYLRKGLNDKTPLYFDGFLTVNTNANNPNIRFKFHNCHPVSLGGINFDTKTDADNIPTCDITFRYDIFEVERI
jgi:hypothetical protein